MNFSVRNINLSPKELHITFTLSLRKCDNPLIIGLSETKTSYTTFIRDSITISGLYGELPLPN